jgi:predicted RNA-binding Zn ribbon-like protein
MADHPVSPPERGVSIPERAWIAAPVEELCLDFANTRYWRGTAEPTEGLGSLDDLLAWCAAKAALPEADIAALRTRWHGRPEESATLFEGVIALREAIYRLFHAIAAGTEPPVADLRLLNEALAAAPKRRELRPMPGGYGWVIEAKEPSALALLTPVLWSAGDLLVSRRLAKLRHCANPQCHWLFVDDSKSGNRRWCSMSACGNRAKAHRHYVRKKGGGGP